MKDEILNKIEILKIGSLKNLNYKRKYKGYKDLIRLVDDFNKTLPQKIDWDSCNVLSMRIDEIRETSRLLLTDANEVDLKNVFKDLEIKTVNISKQIDYVLSSIKPDFGEEVNFELSMLSKAELKSYFIQGVRDTKELDPFKITLPKFENYYILNKDLDKFTIEGFDVPKKMPRVDTYESDNNCGFCTVSALLGITVDELVTKSENMQLESVNIQIMKELFTDMGYNDVTMLDTKTEATTRDYLMKHLKEGQAVGVGFSRNHTDSGHVFTVRKENGDLRVYDYQKNNSILIRGQSFMPSYESTNTHQDFFICVKKANKIKLTNRLSSIKI